MTMNFVVTKSSSLEFVLPSKPTPAGELPLTSTDKPRLILPITSFKVFERPIHEPAQTIRRALSQALVYYYPLAGRLAVRTGCDVHIACTGEGVAFASATASCSLQDVRFLHAPPAIPLVELALRYGGERLSMSSPLLMMQVTEFACGGYAVAVTWNHGIADACGLAQFMQAVGELACGLPSPTVVPIRHDESLPDMPQLVSVIARRSLGFEFTHADYAYTDVTIPWSFINRVKGEFQSHAGVESSCTTFEVVTAIWQCRTRAINAKPNVPAPLMFAVNVRKHVGSKDGYYGNCLYSQLVEARTDEVANGDIVDVVRWIKDTKGKIGESLRVSEDEMELSDEVIATLCGGYNMLSVSSWSGIGLDAVNFGGGWPARVVPNMERTVVPSCFPCLPCSWNENGGHGGANVVAFCVTEDHIEQFHSELEKLR
ncbi:hypothetical protein HU200_048069 [Digitaria exilis]|uniref:Uncharacterized protein n=1 Tax=Digitaria exilis TaxID=1010633 RepID=A0A835ECE8_9POAL|nr:hypothetical protein HU200_048069 [Digitaria exilis]CAB3486552.1 unnamed protein product [Digitaria exilis]